MALSGKSKTPWQEPEGQPLPSLAGLVQEKCEKLLGQVCLPVQG